VLAFRIISVAGVAPAGVPHFGHVLSDAPSSPPHFGHFAAMSAVSFVYDAAIISFPEQVDK
jgi:hypothetical protein